ncbi:MAG: 4Fe-4S ferredoxin, partial [Bacteroidales bacterium]|nr:4Fe-4S ferredoxin [Bacteroidales bacterium]
MEKPKVFFTDFRTKMYGEPIPRKLQRLIRTAGIGNIDFDGKFVAVKMHFGELGNISFLRPNFAKAVVDVIKELGGKP